MNYENANTAKKKLFASNLYYNFKTINGNDALKLKPEISIQK